MEDSPGSLSRSVEVELHTESIIPTRAALNDLSLRKLPLNFQS